MIDELWISWRDSKSLDVRNQIAEFYLPLVKFVADRLAIALPIHIDKDDLFSSGFFGLIEAIDRFDYSRNIKFETFASIRIRGAMIDFLRAKDWVPVSIRQKIRRYERACDELENLYGKTPSDELVAQYLNLSLDDIHDIVAHLQSSNIFPLQDFLTSQQNSNFEHQVELNVALTRAIDILPDNERKVISLYYYEQLTLKEISRIMHLTEARISQLLWAASAWAASAWAASAWAASAAEAAEAVAEAEAEELAEATPSAEAILIFSARYVIINIVNFLPFIGRRTPTVLLPLSRIDFASRSVRRRPRVHAR